MRPQSDRMRLQQEQGQLGVVPPATSHFRGRNPRCAWRPYTHAQAACDDAVHAHVRGVCPAAAQRGADAALPAGVPVERTTRVCIVAVRKRLCQSGCGCGLPGWDTHASARLAIRNMVRRRVAHRGQSPPTHDTQAVFRQGSCALHSLYSLRRRTAAAQGSPSTVYNSPAADPFRPTRVIHSPEREVGALPYSRRVLQEAGSDPPIRWHAPGHCAWTPRCPSHHIVHIPKKLTKRARRASRA